MMKNLRNIKKWFGRGPALIMAVLFSLAASQALADDNCGFTGGDWHVGKKIYGETCIACHGKDGRGTVPGAPDFTKAGGRMSDPHHVITERIEHGFQDANSPMAMPPKGANPSLSEQDIKDVHAYLHHAFGCGGKSPKKTK